MLMRKRVFILIIAVMLITAMMPISAGIAFAADPEPFTMQGVLKGASGTKLISGSYVFFDFDKVCSNTGNDALMETYLEGNEPDRIYFMFEDNDHGIYDWTAAKNKQGDYFIQVTDVQGISGEFFIEIDGKVFKSETFTTVGSNASVDLNDLVLTLNTKAPLPGLKYADVSINDNIEMLKAGGYEQLYSSMYFYTDAGDYIAVYERWYDYMMPSKYSIESFENDNKYTYEVYVDFSNAGDFYKNLYDQFQVKTPNVNWELSYTKCKKDTIAFKGIYTNGIDQYASKNHGIMELDLTGDPIEYDMNDEASENAYDCLDNTLTWLEGQIGADYSNKNIYYYDLDKDGSNDIYAEEDDEKDCCYIGDCPGRSIVGDFEIEPSSELLKRMKVSQGKSFYESLAFKFPQDPVNVFGLKNKTYTGKKQTQKLKVTAKGETLKYKLSYKDRIDVGKATLIIDLTGKYSGTLYKTFKIRPKGTKIASVTPARKALTVKWKKQSEKMSKKRITGYEVWVSTSKKFTKKTTTKTTVTGYKNTSAKIKKLKAKTKYYVKVRTCMTVGGKKFYSEWSEVTTKKTK